MSNCFQSCNLQNSLFQFFIFKKLHNNIFNTHCIFTRSSSSSIGHMNIRHLLYADVKSTVVALSEKFRVLRFWKCFCFSLLRTPTSKCPITVLVLHELLKLWRYQCMSLIVEDVSTPSRDLTFENSSWILHFLSFSCSRRLRGTISTPEWFKVVTCDLIGCSDAICDLIGCLDATCDLIRCSEASCDLIGCLDATCDSDWSGNQTYWRILFLCLVQSEISRSYCRSWTLMSIIDEADIGRRGPIGWRWRLLLLTTFRLASQLVT